MWENALSGVFSDEFHCIRHHVIKMFGLMEVLIHSLLTSALKGELSASCSSNFTPGKEPPVPTGLEAGRAPEPNQTQTLREIGFAPDKN
jgi:hypothetical protein